MTIPTALENAEAFKGELEALLRKHNVEMAIEDGENIINVYGYGKFENGKCTQNCMSLNLPGFFNADNLGNLDCTWPN